MTFIICLAMAKLVGDEKQRRHATNAIVAVYTMSSSLMLRSCMQSLDCTEQVDGTFTLDILPAILCYETDLYWYTAAPSIVGLIVYGECWMFTSYMSHQTAKLDF